MATTMSAAKAKAEFAECVRRAEAGEPVVITRHGKEVVALVRADRFRELERLRAAGLEAAGRPLADADLQIAATALLHDLDLVTGNLRHFSRVPGLRVSPALSESRRGPTATGDTIVVKPYEPDAERWEPGFVRRRPKP